MQFTAEAKNLKMSPRKMRLVVDGIKNMPLMSALAALEVSNKRASDPIVKALRSAMANAVHNGKVSADTLTISEMYVNEGIMFKRYHFAGRGRMRPYKKRTSHLTVKLGVMEKKEVAPVVTEEKAEKAIKVEKKAKKEEGK